MNYDNRNPVAKFFAGVYVKARMFFENIIMDESRLGTNLYTPIFLVEFFCFIYLVLFAPSFTGSHGDLMSYIKNSSIPTSYIVLLIVQFAFIILDRITYLLRSVFMKLVLQYLSVVVFNCLMLWLFPWKMDPEFSDDWKAPFVKSSSLQFFFLVKCLYWYLSGVQIREGYPLMRGERALMRKAVFPYSFFYNVYRAIPFVYEIRTILDWTFTKTTLDFGTYLQVEDIYSELFRVKCKVTHSRSIKRHPGDTRARSEKVSKGFGLFLLIILIIWLPLIFMSSIFTNISSADYIPVSRAEASLALKGWPPLYRQTVIAADALSYPYTADDFKRLRSARPFVVKQRAALQILTLGRNSEALWDIPAPTLAALKAALPPDPAIDVNDDANYDPAADPSPILLHVTISVERSTSSLTHVTRYENEVPLTPSQRRALLSAITDGASSASLLVNNTGFIPRLISLPDATEASTPCEGTRYCREVTFNLAYNKVPGDDTTNYWSFEEVSEEGQVPLKGEISPDPLFYDPDPRFVLIHSQVSTSSSFTGSITGVAIIAICKKIK